MIKFREKLFYRAEVMMWDFPVDEDGNPISFIIKIETSKRFKDGRKNCMTLDKARIKRRDIPFFIFIPQKPLYMRMKSKSLTKKITM